MRFESVARRAGWRRWIWLAGVLLGSRSLLASEVLVLFPLQVDASQEAQASLYGTALQEGLAQRYRVYYGPAVERELEREYQKLDCSAESCAQNVAIAFNGELIGDAQLNQLAGGYAVQLQIRNVITGEIVEARTQSCRDCNALSLLEFLRQFGAGEVAVERQAPSAPRVEQTLPARVNLPQGPDLSGWEPKVAFDGRVGAVSVENRSRYPVQVTLWHPDSRSVFQAFTVEGLQRLTLPYGQGALKVGGDWGVQIGSRRAPVENLVDRARWASHQWQLELGY